MNVTVEVVGEGSRDLEVEDATYADLLAEVDLSPHEASVMVDGRPVPEDEPVETDHVKVLRLIKGGAGDDPGRNLADPDEVGAGPIDEADVAPIDETDVDSALADETGTGPASGERADSASADEAEAGPVSADEAEAGPASAFERERRSLGVSRLDFELPNAGTGPDPLRLSELAADPRNDALVLFFQRDGRCRNCRRQVQDVADRYGEFRARKAAVVSVLPESEETAESWQKKYHLPFALVADEEKDAAAAYGQPTRFGKLGEFSDLLGRMPQTAILDARDGLRLYAVHRGDAPGDRPSVDGVLAMVDRLLADEG